MWRSVPLLSDADRSTARTLQRLALDVANGDVARGGFLELRHGFTVVAKDGFDGKTEGFGDFEVDNGGWVAGIDAECKVLASYLGVDAGEAIAHGEFGVAE